MIDVDGNSRDATNLVDAGVGCQRSSIANETDSSCADPGRVDGNSMFVRTTEGVVNSSLRRCLRFCSARPTVVSIVGGEDLVLILGSRLYYWTVQRSWKDALDLVRRCSVGLGESASGVSYGGLPIFGHVSRGEFRWRWDSFPFKKPSRDRSDHV